MSTDTKVVGGIILLSVFILFGFSLAGGKSGGNTTTSNGKGELVRQDSQSKGPTSAKITLVEFADFQCPYCGAIYPAVHQILGDYGDKIHFVYRNFPLPQHQNADMAARLAAAAGLQGKFWEMADKIFTTQSDWSESTTAQDILVKDAKTLGLDTNKLETDMNNKTIKDRIAQDTSDGNNLGVDSTPTFYLNGKALNPPYSLDTLKKAIDAALK